MTNARLSKPPVAWARRLFAVATVPPERFVDTALDERTPETSDRERLRLHPSVQAHMRSLLAR